VISYLIRRGLLCLFIVFAVVSGSFFLVRLMPGNPIDTIYQQLVQQGGMTQLEIQRRIKVLYGLQPHEPLFHQYLTYIGDVARGNLGHSILSPSTSVTSVLGNAIPWTILVVAVSLIISFTIGVITGTVMAAYAKRTAGKIVTMVATILSAIPNYLIALLLIYLLTDIHHVFPTSGPYSPDVATGFNGPFIGSVAYHAILPIAATTITSFGGWALAMKGSVVGTLGNDYIRASEAWGLTPRRITQSYIGRNSMLPMVTSLALALGGMFGGSVFVETLFSYPGLGYYLVQSVNSRDYTLMMGCFILITVAVVLSNFLVDLLYPLVDPRIARVTDASAVRAARRRAEQAETEAELRQGAA
jgi:peptide/nickel transport system permease protein